MTNELYRQLAERLAVAEREHRTVTKLTAEYPELTVEDAYRIQDELIAIKQRQGHHVAALKMGFTSRAKMKQMNVHEPIYGYVLDYMLCEDGVLSLAELIHPKVEAEIAFILGQDLEGPGITGAQALAATEYVLPALEIIDSRYTHFQFALPDVIADNTSASRVFFGTTLRRPEELELDLVGVTLSINGELRDLGAGAEVLCHPANSVAMLANMLARRGCKLSAGQVILTGGITGAHPVADGDLVVARWDGLGSISFTVQG
ncbi:2-keto-4-pentenoate hydratase [Geobacillus thermodenitrificans]|jgi:2-oxo-3-hexenedioate decarboxylase|uniref:4-oxalocrotonate decarboxylase n=1 Tax=Geobacillus thermodenitrificans (strain NG80-2) TaxID=420246 RepID=A4IT41_GEOTN|nr:fumarylacetoacetate hydrolase family protein [Geobacillus thermodenitrificans]ABO68495.1 4-oxalocrotonate decarboxylase [Geobacillus thermodenitrificans NG80-2]